MHQTEVYTPIKSTVENQIIHIKFLCFLPGRTNSRKLRKLHVVQMDMGNSPHSSSHTCQAIA